MGVVVCQAYPVPQDKTAAQVIDFLQKRIVNLGANLVNFPYVQKHFAQDWRTIYYSIWQYIFDLSLVAKQYHS